MPIKAKPEKRGVRRPLPREGDSNRAHRWAWKVHVEDKQRNGDSEDAVRKRLDSPGHGQHEIDELSVVAGA